MPETSASITRLLQQWRSGDRDAENELFSLVVPKLRQLAQYLMRRERPGHSLQATELVNEIYLRLISAQDQDWRNRQHFFAIAARAMRRYLIDHARGRPHARFTGLDGLENFIPSERAKLDLALEIDRLLEDMAETQPDWCTLVELKFFLGFTDNEAADAMGLKLRTMQRMWLDARHWLFDRTESHNAEPGKE
ncbi:MAG: RNA polymerase subunit sigma-70 [Bryobacteraceae bacterium]|nr:RNA polymerase subunit sigma-70 [Bryobacteraceae bacterium]